ncbi:hypothetical protein AAC387_Pa10g1454 [Persea americana]
MQPPAPDEEEDEEEKMEKFFATIRSIRAAKESWREEPVAKKMRKEDKAVWTPSFQLEDFMKEILMKSPERSPGPSKKDDHEDDKDNGDDSLNLKLSL